MSETKDSLNLAGLEYFTPRDYSRLFLRRKWFILVSTFAIALATATVVFFLPNSYKATAVVQVEHQKVPDSYVNSTVTESSSDRLAALRQQILSSTPLNQIIEDLDLYKNLRKKESPDEVVQEMQKNISLENIAAPVATRGEKSVEAFKISFTYLNASLAAQVANRLAGLFVQENIDNRRKSVEGTTSFLTTELDTAQKDLKEKEDQITELKTKDVGELPESEVMHVQALNALQTQLQSERDAIEKAQQEKAALQASLASSPSVVNLDAQESPAVAGMETEKAQLQDDVDQLRKRYGPSFPDVVKKNIQIKDLQTRIDDAKKKEAAKGAPAPLKERNPVVQSQIAKADEDIQKHQLREQEIQSQIALHQTQLQRIPLFQQRISALTRDYEAAEDHYKHLQERKYSADMAEHMETNQQGERFAVQDSAQMPYKPASPDRPTINLIGLAAGLVISLGLAFVLEVFDPAVKTEREVVGQLGVAVFGEVPWLPTKANDRRRRLRALYACVCGAVLAAGYSAILVATWR